MKARRLHLQELESRQLLTADVLNETAISFAGPIRSGELPADDYYSGSTFVDLDGDGDQDLVFGSSNRAGLQFAINHNGQFVRSESTVRLSEKIQIVTSADFNADGIADFAAAGTTSIFILLGQAENPFAPNESQRISSAATSLAVGDVDNDGAVDLVVGSSRISVFNGNNDGTFQAAIQYGESANAWLVALGDVDADGDMDLAAADESSVRIFANDGGIFETEADQITDATFARMIEFHDINADGQLDLFVGHQIHEETLLAIYTGQGNGTFDHEASHYETLGVPSEVHLADIDNNGSLDMVIGHHSTFHHPVNGNGPGGVSVLLANDRNTFEPAIRLNTPEPQRLLLSDTDQDGRLDISAVQQDAVNTLRMQDDALFAADVTRFSVGNSWSYSDAGDLNGDGRMDVVIATGEYESQRTVIEILLSTESGEFINLSDTQSGIVNGVFIRDFAGNGQATLAMMATGSQRSKIVHWSVGADNKLGDATTTRLSTIWNFHSPQDVDSDGAIDLIGVQGDSQTLASLQWNVDGTFLSHKIIGTFTGYQEPASTDFNGDGLLDYVLTGDRVDVAISTANGSYETQRLSNLQYANAATGDVNGDGHADIVVGSWNATTVRTYLGDGTGSFQDGPQISQSSSEFIVTDFNHDGIDDVALPNYQGLQLYASDGSAFSELPFLATPFYPAQALTNDFDADGQADTVIVPYEAGIGLNQAQLSLLRLGADQQLETVSVSMPFAYSGKARIVDFDGDGNLDVIGNTLGGMFVTYGANGSSANSGDVNQDGSINIEDIDLICAAVYDSPSDPDELDRMDLNRDQQITATDVDILLSDILNTVAGDVNLDGKFDSADLVQIFQASEYEDNVTGNSRWSEGDWNCDGDFSTADLVYVFQKGTYSRE